MVRVTFSDAARSAYEAIQDDAILASRRVDAELESWIAASAAAFISLRKRAFWQETGGG